MSSGSNARLMRDSSAGERLPSKGSTKGNFTNPPACLAHRGNEQESGHVGYAPDAPAAVTDSKSGSRRPSTHASSKIGASACPDAIALKRLSTSIHLIALLVKFYLRVAAAQAPILCSLKWATLIVSNLFLPNS